jgi:hypothetical protein
MKDLYPNRAQELMALANPTNDFLYFELKKYMKIEFLERLNNLVGERETLSFRILLGNKSLA